MSDQNSHGDSSAILRPARLTGILLLCGLIMLLDGFDLTAMPLAVPRMALAWHLSPARFGMALSAALVGLGVGAMFLGPLGDRRGRKPVIVFGLGVLGLITLGTALARSPEQLVLWRFGVGATLGACLANVTALVSELAPPRRRAGLLTLVSCGISIGAIGSGLLAPLLTAQGRWQPLFVAPGVFTLLLALLAALGLPESPLLLQARAARSRSGDSRTSDPSPPSILAPLYRPHRRATAVFVVLYTMNSTILYMILSWLPTILPQVGFSLDQAARLSAMQSLGGLAGGLLLSWFVDGGRPVLSLVTGYLIVTGALMGFSLVHPGLLGWGLLLILVGGGIQGMSLAILAVSTGYFPVPMRSAAIGYVIAFARLGAIAGPLAGSLLIAEGIGPRGFFLAALIPVAFCSIAVLLIPSLTSRPSASQAGPTGQLDSQRVN